jgi:hypothetical protein
MFNSVEVLLLYIYEEYVSMNRAKNPRSFSAVLYTLPSSDS